ncbi:hypothetical protein JYJ95_09545 [Corallococcus exiguus]|uniref:hypothetical protein n=1 Tax=Corallococcus exiguus TaxID=83462 RepID=UPI001A8DE5D4|nr:hypothetical protein [Corallococcus exiguus]MBN8466759.1 hypothetical protein [Corallococcus exiguus]
MNLERVDEYAGDSEFDREFLREVARRAELLWGEEKDEVVVFGTVFVLWNMTIHFRDGFVINDFSDLNTFPGVNGACAVVAAVWDWLGLSWTQVELRFRRGAAKDREGVSPTPLLLAKARAHPSVALVD